MRAMDAVRTLDPGYFALVMATGIVSIGLRGLGVPALSAALLWLAAAGYVVLVVLHGWRLVAFPGRARGDLADPARGFGYFTFVAGTDVLGTRLALAGHHGTAAALLAAGGLVWLALGYLIPWAAALGRAARPVVAGANGAWFLWVVATQSVAVLAAAVEPAAGAGRRELALLAVSCWSVGACLYAAVGVLTAVRLLLYETRPADLTPAYWVAMGATAITVLAGARIDQMAAAPAVAATRGLIAGVSVVFWAFGTWLIPPLLAAGWWRHVTHRVPLRYDPSWWSVVFPLGMYGVATRALGDVDHLPLLAATGRHEMWVALAAWAATSLAMLAHLARALSRAER
jgi:tellurite resistance protein TehA-like permease